MLIHSASQLLTLTPEPQRGTALGDLGLIPDGAVLIRGEEIAAVGTTAELRAAYPGEPEYDASGRVVMSGFVDPHTHLVFGGSRGARSITPSSKSRASGAGESISSSCCRAS